MVYCDPPYEGTAEYNKESFNHKEFYDWVASRPFEVFFSSYDNISDKRFLSYACVKEYGSCFYNISNDFIENFKIKLLSKINYDIKIGLLMIINLIIIGFLDTKRVRGKYNG